MADSPEAVALAMAQHIASKDPRGSLLANARQEFLDLYAECLAAANGKRGRDPSEPPLKVL